MTHPNGWRPLGRNGRPIRPTQLDTELGTVVATGAALGDTDVTAGDPEPFDIADREGFTGSPVPGQVATIPTPRRVAAGMDWLGSTHFLDGTAAVCIASARDRTEVTIITGGAVLIAPDERSARSMATSCLVLVPGPFTIRTAGEVWAFASPAQVAAAGAPITVAVVDVGP